MDLRSARLSIAPFAPMRAGFAADILAYFDVRTRTGLWSRTLQFCRPGDAVADWGSPHMRVSVALRRLALVASVPSLLAGLPLAPAFAAGTVTGVTPSNPQVNDAPVDVTFTTSDTYLPAGSKPTVT